MEKQRIFSLIILTKIIMIIVHYFKIFVQNTIKIVSLFSSVDYNVLEKSKINLFLLRIPQIKTYT